MVQNAYDSLNEGLRKYESAQAGDQRAYKFAVLHFAHFVELLLKAAVAAQHALLVYRNPASKDLQRENSIGVREALAILTNCGLQFSHTVMADVEWLRLLRNRIEHFAFTLDILEVRAVLGRLLRASLSFAIAAGVSDVRDLIHLDCRDVFDRLLDEYLERVANAQADAEHEERTRGGFIVDCGLCGQSNVAVEGGPNIHCFFCRCDDPVVACDVCYNNHPKSTMRLWNNGNADPGGYVCVDCEWR